MLGERFIDALLADTLSERYRPCKEVEHMPGQGAIDMLMEAYPLEINSCSWCADGGCSCLHVRTPLEDHLATLALTSDGLDGHDCLRSPLNRLCDWFAGLFAIDTPLSFM